MKRIEELTADDLLRVMGQTGVQPTPLPELPVVEQWETDNKRAKSAEHRVNWDRLEQDQTYFNEKRRSGEWQAAVAARTERIASEQRAIEQAEHEERLRLKLESLDRARDAERDRLEARRAADSLARTNDYRKQQKLPPIDASGKVIY